MSSFDEYDKATSLKGKSPSDTVPAAAFGDKAASDRILSPQASDRPSTALYQERMAIDATTTDNVGAGAARPAQGSVSGPTSYVIKESKDDSSNPWLFWLVILILGLAIGFWLKGCTMPVITEIKAPIRAEVEDEIKTLKAENKRLEGANAWLRHLLKVEQAKNADLRKLLDQAEQYRLWAIDALKTFYSTPFAVGEGSREICFTYDINQTKCYQLTNPAHKNAVQIQGLK